MFRVLRSLFRQVRVPAAPFVDEVLGTFRFDTDLGWKTLVTINGAEVELVIGSDGEEPSHDMIRTARMLASEWPNRWPLLLDYMGNELEGEGWKMEPDLPNPERFILQSINVLWPDAPTTSMAYFDYPGDDIRLWHITLDGFTPRGFAYDD